MSHIVHKFIGLRQSGKSLFDAIQFLDVPVNGGSQLILVSVFSTKNVPYEIDTLLARNK